MNHGQVHLKRLRFLVLLFSIITGGLFAARWDIIVEDNKRHNNFLGQKYIYELALGNTHEAIELAVPRVVVVLFTYALWGRPLKFIHKNLGAVVLLAIAVCWLYVTIGDLTDLIPDRHDYAILNCLKSYKECHHGRASSLIEAIAGPAMEFEVYVSFKIGPPDLKFRKHQFNVYGGYNSDANVIDVRPDEPQQCQPSPAPPPVLHFSSPPLPGAARVPTKVRSFLVFDLAYGLLYCCLSVLFLIPGNYNVGSGSSTPILVCDPGDDPCQILKTAQVLGSIAGCMMVLEVIMTARLGPLDRVSESIGTRQQEGMVDIKQVPM
ncbi:hypothetical protein BG000_003248 [Podila horticola]|nr:hypothetical protein BG000_003248 [Podila horticola]